MSTDRLVTLDNGFKVSVILCKTLFQDVPLMHSLLDGPEHEDDRCNDSEGQSVGEVGVEGQFDKVMAQTQRAGCLHHGSEDPEADGGLQQRQRQGGKHLRVGHII